MSGGANVYAIISDIHSNIEALRAVFRVIERRGIEEVVCLGDVIGYGPDPEPCIDFFIKRKWSVPEALGGCCCVGAQW